MRTSLNLVILFTSALATGCAHSLQTSVKSPLKDPENCTLTQETVVTRGSKVVSSRAELVSTDAAKIYTETCWAERLRSERREGALKVLAVRAAMELKGPDGSDMAFSKRLLAALDSEQPALSTLTKKIIGDQGLNSDALRRKAANKATCSEIQSRDDGSLVFICS